MKRRLTLGLVFAFVFLFSAPNALATCTPSGTNTGETYSGCFLISKEVRWLISWPDFEDYINTSGTGKCAAGNVCCDSTLRVTECWPEFNQPTTTTSGTWKQVVVNKQFAYGNRFRYRAKVKDTHDAQLGRWAWDVFLVGGQ